LGTETDRALGFQLRDFQRPRRRGAVDLDLRRIDGGTRLTQHDLGTAGAPGGQQHGEHDGNGAERHDGFSLGMQAIFRRKA